MTFYFGKPAAGLVALPNPLRGITPTNDRAATVHVSSSGGRQVDLAPSTRRTFTIQWAWLDPATFSVLEEFFTGARGPGPFVLLDPGRRNHLTANQSGVTSQTNDPTGFIVGAGSGESLASAVAPFLRGPRSLRWVLPATVTAGVLDLSPPFGLVGWPAVAAQPWTFSGQVTAPGQAPSVSITPALSWRRRDGTEVAATLGTPVAATGAAWSSFSVSLGTPPAGALYVRPQVRVAAGALFTAGYGPDADVDLYAAQSVWPRVTAPAVAGVNRPAVHSPNAAGWGQRGAVILTQAPILTTDVYLDQLQFDLFASVRPWAVGTGVPQVSMTALPETYQILPDRHVTATFVEVS